MKITGIEPVGKKKVYDISDRLGINPEDLISAMSFETGGTFDPAKVNPASGAAGLIQFMPSTAKSLGTTVEDLAKMSQTQQLDYVEKYLKPYKGKIQSLEDLYMAILWPKAIGKSNDSILFKQGSKEYQQNAGLDISKKGFITKSDAASKVSSRKRLLFNNVGSGTTLN